MTENMLKFQPATKRFIAWDKYHKAWVTKFLMPSTDNKDSDDWTCPLTLGRKGQAMWLNNDQLIICQSTSVFDKHGREIFDGSIVKDFDDVLGYVYFDEDVLGWRVLYQNGDWDDLYNAKAEIVCIGHILSDPKLLEVEQHDNSL